MHRPRRRAPRFSDPEPVATGSADRREARRRPPLWHYLFAAVLASA